MVIWDTYGLGQMVTTENAFLTATMTTASVLLTVGTTWSASSEKCDKEERLSRSPWNHVAVAALELRETPATRDQALRMMREWIQKNGDIRNVKQGGFGKTFSVLLFNANYFYTIDKTRLTIFIDISPCNSE